jgi:hypothetical protein
MKENNWRFEEAFIFVKSSRQQIFPNFGFQKQLKKFEIDLGFITQEQFLEQTKFKTVLVK